MKKLMLQVKWWELLLLYFILYFIFRYIVFFSIREIAGEKPLGLPNFIIYNYLFNGFLLLVKLISFSLFVIVGNTLWNVKGRYSDVLKALICGQFVYFFKYISFIVYAYFINKSFDYSSGFEVFKLKISLIFDPGQQGFIYGIFSSITLYDLLFILITAYVYSLLSNLKPSAGFKVIGSTLLPVYGIYVLVLQFLKTF